MNNWQIASFFASIPAVVTFAGAVFFGWSWHAPALLYNLAFSLLYWGTRPK